jgi:hypothetical protein
MELKKTACFFPAHHFTRFTFLFTMLNERISGRADVTGINAALPPGTLVHVTSAEESELVKAAMALPFKPPIVIE